MCPPPAADDPTHALDDFVHRMRATAPATPLPPEVNLHVDSGHTPSPGRPRRDNSAAVDAPLLDLRAVRQAAAQQAPDPAAAQHGWQPQPHAVQLRHTANPRLLADWRPGAWTGALRQVLPASTEFVTTAAGPVVETYPPQHLLLLWPPQRLDMPLLGRWPQQARLSAVPADTAGQALLAALPDDALLWLQPATGSIDWALAAEIVLHHDSTLRPFQAQGLRDFINSEREATFAHLNSGYQAAPGGAVARA